jgi:hypothetical protein
LGRSSTARWTWARMTKRDLPNVEYQPPGSSEWHRVREPPRASESVLLRREARRLLAQGEEVARQILRRSQEQERSEAELLELERDMAAALGSFERMVAAGAKKLKFDAEDALRDLKKKK